MSWFYIESPFITLCFLGFVVRLQFTFAVFLIAFVGNCFFFFGGVDGLHAFICGGDNKLFLCLLLCLHPQNMTMLWLHCPDMLHCCRICHALLTYPFFCAGLVALLHLHKVFPGIIYFTALTVHPGAFPPRFLSTSPP